MNDPRIGPVLWLQRLRLLCLKGPAINLQSLNAYNPSWEYLKENLLVVIADEFEDSTLATSYRPDFTFP